MPYIYIYLQVKNKKKIKGCVRSSASEEEHIATTDTGYRTMDTSVDNGDKTMDNSAEGISTCEADASLPVSTKVHNFNL